MKFFSTRGLAPVADLRHVALEGLAPDGGLYLPEAWPHFSAEDLGSMRGKPYNEIAFRVLSPFLREGIPDADLKTLIEKAYASFATSKVTPLRPMGEDFILELFHGPTLAFKDVALQFVGHAFDYFLKNENKRKTVIGATSGDTGSAAIEALANRENVDVFILYPDRGPSEIQRKQMTCVDASNVHTLAIDGSFDDCQSIVKGLFADKELRKAWNPTTVNSINLLRILAQIVYYFVAALEVNGAPTFVVPTGNFGDIFAGYAAKACGLPVEKLVVASNSNNILTRFFATGDMTPEPVRRTLSPSMDIQISSNFERVLFDLCEKDGSRVRGLMESLRNEGRFAVSTAALDEARKTFAAGFATDEETLATMADVYKQYGIVLDPHTAVGVNVARKLKLESGSPVVFLSTADAAKFPETTARALGFAPSVPERVAKLISKKERTTPMVADIRKVAAFIEENGNR